MALIYLNDLSSNLDPGFIKTPLGFVADDSTSRPILGLGDKLNLDSPPLTAGDFGRLRSSIEGYDEFNTGRIGKTIYRNYSEIDKGQIQYYIDTDFINPFTPFFKDTNHLSFKQQSRDRTIEYTREPIIPIQKNTSFNQVYGARLMKLENPAIYSGSPMGPAPARGNGGEIGGLQFKAQEGRMGPNALDNPNQWFVDTQNQREDVQALQMRTMIRNNYAPAQLF